MGDLELESCVNGFNEDNFIGKFQFGDVYRGIYEEKDVIVKIWKEEKLPGENKGRLEDERLLHAYFNKYEFHPNVAKAFAICHGRKHLAIVYHMNPKPIDTLHNLIEKDTFTWAHRIKVAFGLASLLRYIHTPHPNCPSNLPYLIRNINPAHILVDQDHEPILFDFSMISGGILTDKRDLINQHLQGCCGYNDPICDQPGPGRWLDRSDVFSYGVVLLSLISKKIYKDDSNYCTDVLPLICTEWAKNEHKVQHNYSVASFGKSKSSLVHQSLELEPDFYFSDATKITNLALLCVEYDPWRRPSMDQIVRYMQNMHIVQHNANTWECCKMLDGVNVVYQMLNPPKYKHLRVKEFWQPSNWHRGLLVNRFNHLSHGNKGRGQSLAMIKSSIVEDNMLRVFSYKELINATSNFGKENVIDQFKFGNFFRGEVEGKKVIVKIWEINEERGVYARSSEDRLRDEISLLQHPELCNHPNLVKMIGYCFEEKKLGIVYDLDPQDTLHNLADELTWLQKMKVIYELANLLKFFHAPNPPHAPYRVGNVKATNIILDKDFRPKLFEFGMTVGGIILSLRCIRNISVIGRRTDGYGGDMSRGIYIESGDIGAYGWILLCLISKTSLTPEDDHPLYDTMLRWDGLDESAEVIDKSGISLVHKDLKQEPGFYENDGVELTKLGLECTSALYRRPSMEEVVKRLHKLHVIRRHAKEMGIQNLPCRYNANFELVCQTEPSELYVLST